MDKHDVLWVTNIPAPYRNHAYAKMARLFPEHGLNFEVLYMARTERDRHWTFEDSDFDYPHRFYRGLHGQVLGSKQHFNPGLLAELRGRRGQIIVVGGYSSVTHALAPFACGSRNLRILASESNLASTRWRSGAARRLKRVVVSRYDGFVVSGHRARELIEWLWPEAARRPFVEFPNLINADLYHRRVLELRRDRARIRAEHGVGDDDQLWLCPARLEEFKGLDLLIPQLEGLSGIRLVVAGEGGLRGALQEQIDSRGLPVSLLGQVDGDGMVRLYAAADLFVLPSRRDPSPLSPIEACAAQLPLFVSTKIGNYDDVLREGENGWGFDVEHPQSNRSKLEWIVARTRQQLAEMGRISFSIYRSRFDSDTCVRRLAEGLRELHDRRMHAG